MACAIRDCPSKFVETKGSHNYMIAITTQRSRSDTFPERFMLLLRPHSFAIGMLPGLVTLAGSRDCTSLADIDEVIDDALNQFEDLLKLA